ncbi:MAG: RagB/SusD family nutrient uptake outer membrane protein [Candidatus Nephrothrix sp. EaCA]|nr:MAG: RagB/SusD family nutrient uptake outer membrane protein [Candidatus Nephrothrix sp. EaCA]
MKLFSLFMLFALAALPSCRNFIDEVRDNRTLIDSEDKAAQLLVYAYVNAQYAVFAESMSDNADDNGTSGTGYAKYDQANMEAYLWKDYESMTDKDTPSNFWIESYKAIAQANQALVSLEKLNLKTKRSASLRGEALLARAYAHFMLANLFALRYDPATASAALGIPYILSPEQNAIVQYRRETMAETYRLIEKDLTEGLPLIGNDYEKPKFHFSPKSAHAFAARFFLYKGEWDKVIKYASVVLGDAPATAIRDWVAESYRKLPATEQRIAYSAPTERANLLIGWTGSLVGRLVGLYRFGLSAEKQSKLFYPVNLFGKKWAYPIYYNKIESNRFIPKYREYFRYTNVSAGTGYPNASFVHFTADEALLNRAEAYAMLDRFEEASNDLTAFLSIKTIGFNADRDRVTPELMGSAYPKRNDEYTPFYPLSNDQASFVKGIAEFRRREFCHEGMRWLDIKRFNLAVTHKQARADSLVLQKNDLRKAIQIPETAKAFGITPNKR